MSKGDRAEDYASADSSVLGLIAQESDKRIAAQVQIMLASDTRSNAVLAAAATLAAAGYAVAGSQLSPNGNYPLLIGASAFALMATAAAISAIWALWPTGVEVPGWSPRLFTGDIREKKTIEQILAEIVAHNETKIAENEACNRKLAQRARTTMFLLGLAPIVGALTLLVFSLIAASPPPRSAPSPSGTAAAGCSSPTTAPCTATSR